MHAHVAFTGLPSHILHRRPGFSIGASMVVDAPILRGDCLAIAGGG